MTMIKELMLAAALITNDLNDFGYQSLDVTVSLKGPGSTLVTVNLPPNTKTVGPFAVTLAGGEPVDQYNNLLVHEQGANYVTLLLTDRVTRKRSYKVKVYIKTCEAIQRWCSQS